jgi:hypothetical protein
MPYYQNPEKIPTLLEALNNYSVEQLKSLLPLLPTQEKPARKTELVEVIFRCLKGNGLQQLWGQLDSVQQAAVSETVHSPNSQLEQERFKAKYGQVPNLGTWASYGRNNKPTLLRLFFYSYDIMPEDLKERLKAFVPSPKKANMKSLDELPTHIERKWETYDWETRKRESGIVEIPLEVREMERAAINDLTAVLRLIQTGKVSVSDKTRLPTASSQQAITALLQDGDYYADPPKEERQPYDQIVGSIRAYAWSLIVQAAGLAELSGKKLSLTKVGQKALSEPPSKILKSAWNKWLKTTLLDELRRIDAIKGQTGKGQRGLTAVAGRRKALVAALEDCPVSRWVNINEFFRYIRATGQEFEVSRQPWNLYVCEAGYGSLDVLDGGWSLLEERYALCFLFEYAATLGTIDVAYVPPAGSRDNYTDLWGVDDLEFLSRYDGLLYFRLTPLGAYCLGLTDTYTPAPLEVRHALKVLPNLEIAAVGASLTPGDLLVLEQYTKPASDAVWRLELGHLLGALAKGQRVSEFREFLQARSREPLPETVEQIFKDAEERSESLQDRGTTRLIECRDPALAALIANDSRTKKYCLLAGERFLVVPLESETQFRNALQKLGYSLPK